MDRVWSPTIPPLASDSGSILFPLPIHRFLAMTTKKRGRFYGLNLWSWRESNPPFPMLLIIFYVSNLCFLTGLRF